MAKNDIDPVAGVILLIALVFAFSSLILYLIAITLQPFFIALTFVSVIALILFGFLWYQEKEDSMAIGFAVSLLILIISIGGWIITINIIQEVTSSPEGQEQIGMYNSIMGVPEIVYSTFNKALQQQIEETCKIADKETCNLMRTTVETSEDLIEITDMINQGKRYAEIAKRLEKSIN